LNIVLTVTLGLYTLGILIGILHYENKLTSMRSAISDYERAIKLSRGSEHYRHYTQLQLDISSLDYENKALQNYIQELKAENAVLRNVSNPSIWSVRPLTDSAVYVAGESKDMHYESSIYKSGIWDSKYANETMLEEEPFGVTPNLNFSDELDF